MCYEYTRISPLPLSLYLFSVLSQSRATSKNAMSFPWCAAGPSLVPLAMAELDSFALASLPGVIGGHWTLPCLRLGLADILIADAPTPNPTANRQLDTGQPITAPRKSFSPRWILRKCRANSIDYCGI